MKDLQLEQKALKLLDYLTAHAELGNDNIKYLAFVLQSWYDDGYRDAIYKVEREHEKIL